MTRVRRPLAAAAGLALAALVTLPTGAAGQVDEETRTEWELEWTTVAGQAFRDDLATITGTVTSPTGTTITEVRLTATRVSESPPCPGGSTELAITAYPDNDGGTQVTQPETGRSSFDFSFPLRSTICNGDYHLQVAATADGDAPPAPSPAPPAPIDDDEEKVFASDSERLGVTLALRPPDVMATSVASADGRTITVSWQPPPNYSATSAGATPPDFLGYVVQRSTDGGTTFGRRANLGPTVSSFSETLGPSDRAGTYLYRVLAVRYGATTSEFAVAAGGATAIGRIDAAAPPTSAPPTTARRPTPTAPSRPTANAAPRVDGAIPPTTIDEGFGELVYDDEEPGEEAAVLPDDADSLLDLASPGAGLLVPFAIAECLAVWALHLRYLARRVDAGI